MHDWTWAFLSALLVCFCPLSTFDTLDGTKIFITFAHRFPNSAPECRKNAKTDFTATLRREVGCDV